MEIHLYVLDMHCEGCVERIKKVLEKIKGVKDFTIDLEKKLVHLTVKNEKIGKEVTKKIEDIGFSIKIKETD